VKRPRLRVLVALTAFAVGAAGCQAGYVLRQGFHQLNLGGKEIPLDSPALDSQAGAGVAQKLRWVPEILRFARERLALEPGDSYRTYLDTKGPVSHAVTASHPLALAAYQWRFPLIGAVPYKGYFDPADAAAEAERLRKLGLETLVTPVMAFSTLGWFDDPVVASMLEGSVADLVDVIIHETTHRTVYFPGASSFNESCATFIARRGTVEFLGSHESLQPLLAEYLESHEAALRREQLLLRLRNDLDALYRSPAPEAQKLLRKAEMFATANAAYRSLLDRRSNTTLAASNAFVLSVARYHEYEHLLDDLEKELGGGPAAVVTFLRGLPSHSNPLNAVQRRLGRMEGESQL
jgi:predicted aminopeptidase